MSNNQIWEVCFHKVFVAEFYEFPQELQDELLAKFPLLEIVGPQLGRPYADTLNNSRYPNMKELRFNFKDGVWLVAYAFDPNRQAIILIAGNKFGVSKQRFYKPFIKEAD